MTGLDIKWDEDEGGLVIPALEEQHSLPGGRTYRSVALIRVMDSDHAFGDSALLRDVSLTRLRLAMVQAANSLEREPASGETLFELTWSAFEMDAFDEDLALASSTSICLDSDHSLVLDAILTSDPRDAEVARDPEFFGAEPSDATWPEGEALAREWLNARGLELLSFTPADEVPNQTTLWRARVSLTTRGRTVGDAMRTADELTEYLSAIADGRLTPASLASVLRTGNAHVLIGVDEDDVLEAKRFLRIDDELDELELAKDVAAFANAGQGGVIVYGIGTKRQRGRDVLRSLHPFTADGQDRLVRRLIDRRIFPPIEQLTVALVPCRDDDGHLLMIHIPAQPRELQPFLVRGVSIAGKSKGNMFGIYRRRGDDVLASSPEGIHAALAAGLALLRGTRDPSRDSAHPS